MIAYLRRRREARRDAADWRVLYAMRDGREHFVYPLTRAIGTRPGTIYPTLTRLERAGLVCSGWQSYGVDPRRHRRWYRLSPEGLRSMEIRVIPS